eukprot:Skav219595  [mRNA]  locus=scaffold1719:133114:134203:+ [translate_table: standard]
MRHIASQKRSNKRWIGLISRYLEFCKHLGSFFERDPKIISSVVKYSMMEIKQAMDSGERGDHQVSSSRHQVVKEEVMDTLQQHTRMLQEQRLLLDNLRPQQSGDGERLS